MPRVIFREEHLYKQIICVDAGEKVPLTVNPGISKNNEYKLYRFKNMPCCGRQVVDIGFRAQGSFIECICGGINETTDGIWWMYAFRFAPITAELRKLAWEEIAAKAFAGDN